MHLCHLGLGIVHNWLKKRLNVVKIYVLSSTILKYLILHQINKV